jgi:hypothetical protein
MSKRKILTVIILATGAIMFLALHHPESIRLNDFADGRAVVRIDSTEVYMDRYGNQSELSVLACCKFWHSRPRARAQPDGDC